MKVYFAICFAAMFHVISSADNNCIMIPDVRVKSCCTQSEILDKKILDDAYEHVLALNISNSLHQCRIHEEIFVKLNLVDKDGGVDKEASIKFIEEHVSDDEWKNVYKDSLERCIPEMKLRSVVFQNRSGVARETCNFIFDAVLLCMDISTFMSCPQKSVVDATGCADAKEFVTKCHKNDKAMEKFAMMQAF